MCACASALLTAHAPLTAGLPRALLACAVLLLAVAITLRASNTRGEPAQPGGVPGAFGQVPVPESAD